MSVMLGEPLRELPRFRLDPGGAIEAPGAATSEIGDEEDVDVDSRATQVLTEVPLLRRRGGEAMADFHNQRPPPPV